MVELHRLSNGIRVVLEPMDYVHSASIGIYIKAGSAYETKQNNGIAHVVEHMLFKGTTNKSAKEQAKAFAQIGGDVNAYTSKEDTCYYTIVLDEYCIEAITLLADMLCNATIEEQELQKELDVILEEIDMYQDSPEDLAIEHLQEISLPNSALGYFISGKKEVVSNFTRCDVIQFIEDFYTADRIVISIAGHINQTEVLRALEENFSNIKRQGKQVIHQKATFVPNVSFLHKEIEQMHMAMGFLGSGYRQQEKYAQAIVSQCLGESDDSRLFQKLREDLGLAYSVYSFTNTYETMGMFQIYVAMNSKKIQKTEKEIMLILKDIRREGITQEELHCAKEQLRADILMNLDSSESRMEQNGKSLLLLGKLDDSKEKVRQLLEVSCEDVNAYIQRYIQPKHASLVFVGNQKEMKEDLYMKKDFRERL